MLGYILVFALFWGFGYMMAMPFILTKYPGRYYNVHFYLRLILIVSMFLMPFLLIMGE